MLAYLQRIEIQNIPKKNISRENIDLEFFFFRIKLFTCHVYSNSKQRISQESLVNKQF